MVGAAYMTSQAEITVDCEAFEGSEMKQQLDDFLDATPALVVDGNDTNKDVDDSDGVTKDCIYMGWGSMSSRSPQCMTEFAVGTLCLVKKRGIWLQGYANLGQHHIQDEELLACAQKNVLFVPSVPREGLFPRVFYTVHHGRSGITTAALRAGRPTVVAPVCLDQWDLADGLNETGCRVGFAKKQLQSMSSHELAEAIETVLGAPSIAQKPRRWESNCARKKELFGPWRRLKRIGKSASSRASSLISFLHRNPPTRRTPDRQEANHIPCLRGRYWPL